MRHRLLTALIAAVLVLTAGVAAAAPVSTADPALAPSCAPGDAVAAGAVLFGSGTELAQTDTVAGLRTALVLEPYIAPGTRHRMIAVNGGWCDAERAFNHAWVANGRSFRDGKAAATVYARLAAAPYFDQTTVTSQVSAASVHTITTHALTNGIDALWTVVTDAEGVRSAKWATTGFAVKPFVGQWEGLTALDGASERYSRLADGRLLAARGLPTGDVRAPAAEVSYTGPDGFKIVIGIGESRNAVDVGQDTGNSRVDILRMTRDVLAENYKDFYDWGFRANWAPARTRVFLVNVGGVANIPAPAKTGYVYFNNATSVYCLACVFIADDFQIHFSSEVPAQLAALGYTYPGASDRDVYANVLGHEMMHNWQNNYVKPTSTGRSTPGSYSEGTARMQETLHSYSHINHAPSTLVYTNTSNGCNGLTYSGADTTMAWGPFQLTAYEACNFWLPWYGAEGIEGLTKLVTEGAAVGASEPGANNAGKVIAAIEHTTGEGYTVSAADWAAGLITGKGMTWGPIVGPGDTKDWGHYLQRWRPTTLAVGESVTRTLDDGGQMANEVTTAFRPSVTEGANLAVIRDSAAGTSITYPANGTLVDGPAEGERVWVLAVHPVQGSAATTLQLSAP